MADEDVPEQIAPPPEPKPDDDDEPSGPGIDGEAWMMSFGDLVSLMLVFFVMLFSMSTLEVEEFEAIVSALAQQFNPAAELKRPKPSVDLDIPKVASREAYDLSYLRALIEDKLAGNVLLADIQMHELHDRLVISLPADPMFEPGTARMTATAHDTLDKLGTVIRFLSNRIDVNGHTDPDPVISPVFPSNWEFSLARAMSVANELRRAGFAEGAHSFGFADSRFSEISLDLPVQDRYRTARRIDIVIRNEQSQGRSR